MLLLLGTTVPEQRNLRERVKHWQTVVKNLAIKEACFRKKIMCKLLSEFCSKVVISLTVKIIRFTNRPPLFTNKCCKIKISKLMGISNTERKSVCRDERKYDTKTKHNKPKQKLLFACLHDDDELFWFSSTSNVSLRFYKKSFSN